jgi:hypothetical protein
MPAGGAMTEPLKPLKPGDTITDPETGEQLKVITKTRPDTWMDKLCRELGIVMNEVEPPKGFIRVIFPRTPDQDSQNK